MLAVPRLYVQVCHLMNKMNLPPPFEARFPDVPFPVAAGAAVMPRQWVGGRGEASAAMVEGGGGEEVEGEEDEEEEEEEEEEPPEELFIDKGSSLAAGAWS